MRHYTIETKYYRGGWDVWMTLNTKKESLQELSELRKEIKTATHHDMHVKKARLVEWTGKVTA